MTQDQLITAYDSVFFVKDRLPSGGVGSFLHRGQQWTVGYVDRNPFFLSVRVVIGVRGGIYGSAMLVDSRIKPDCDAIQIAELEDFSNDRWFPMSALFYESDHRTNPSRQDIEFFLARCLTNIPTDLGSLEKRFRDPFIRLPANSVTALPGGATGLGR